MREYGGIMVKMVKWVKMRNNDQAKKIKYF